MLEKVDKEEIVLKIGNGQTYYKKEFCLKKKKQKKNCNDLDVICYS